MRWRPTLCYLAIKSEGIQPTGPKIHRKYQLNQPAVCTQLSCGRCWASWNWRAMWATCLTVSQRCVRWVFLKQITWFQGIFLRRNEKTNSLVPRRLGDDPFDFGFWPIFKEGLLGRVKQFEPLILSLCAALIMYLFGGFCRNIFTNLQPKITTWDQKWPDISSKFEVNIHEIHMKFTWVRVKIPTNAIDAFHRCRVGHLQIFPIFYVGKLWESTCGTGVSAAWEFCHPLTGFLGVRWVQGFFFWERGTLVLCGGENFQSGWNF